MQNKIISLLVAVVLLQLVYFLVQSLKARLKASNSNLKSTANVRAYIVLILLFLLVLFTLL